MKKLYIGIFAMLTVMTISCEGIINVPEQYEEEIQDAVKFYIAEATYIIDLAQNPLFAMASLFVSEDMEEMVDKMESEFIDLYENNDMSYRQALEFVAQQNESDFQDDAQHILEYYNSLNVVLSDYKSYSTKVDHKSWTFKELHSGIEFVFEVRNLQSDTPIWLCSPVEESYINYFTKAVE